MKSKILEFIENNTDVPHENDSRTVFGIGLVRSEYREEGVLSYGRNCYAIEIRLL